MDRPLESLLAEEAELQFSKLNSAVAWKLGNWLVKRAQNNDLRIAVGISLGGRRVFHWAADGTVADNDAWIDRKVRTVLRFGHSSFYMGRKLAKEQISAEAKYHVDERDFAFDGGSFPLVLKGFGVVGAVTVSGLKQDQDHDLAVEALRAVLSGSR